MKGDNSNISPIMTSIESVDQLGNNAYVDLNNNSCPAQEVPTRFELYKKENGGTRPNSMEQAN